MELTFFVAPVLSGRVRFLSDAGDDTNAIRTHMEYTAAMPTMEPPRVHPLQPVVGIFVAPVRAMQMIRAVPRVVPPLLVAVVTWLAVGLAAAPRALDVIVDQIHASSDLDAAERDDVVRWIEDHETFANGILAVGGTFSMLITVALWALILHAGITMTFAERPEAYAFTNTLSIAAHANLVNVPQFLLQVLLLSAGSEASLSLAGLVGVGAGTPLGTALAWVSPFNLWWLALLGLGIAVTMRIALTRAILVPLVISLGLRTLQIAFVFFTGSGGDA